VSCSQDQEGRCVEYLLGHKALPSLPDLRGFNALHYAAAAGNSNALQHLLSYGGSELFVSRCAEGQEVTSAMHLAAYYGHRDALLILMAKFGNVEVLDGRGRSPLYLASYTGAHSFKGFDKAGNSI